MSTESENSGPERNAILARACDTCRMKKIGCDKKYPCSRCKTHGLVCQASTPRARDKKQRIHVSEKFEKQMDSLHARLENIENLLLHRIDDPRSPPFVEPSNSLPTKVQIDEQLVQTRSHINSSNLILRSSEIGPLTVIDNIESGNSNRIYMGDSSLLSATTEAKNLLERGLTPESGGGMDEERNPSLATAMKALRQLMKSKHHDEIYFPTDTAYKQEMSMKSLPVPPLADIFRIMQDESLVRQGFWPMIPIRRDRFMSMYREVAASLPNERVNTAAFLCVNAFLPFLFQQLLMLQHAETHDTGLTSSKIEEILRNCTYNSQVAARNLGLLMAPTLENILALLFASLVAQENGTPGECWTYASHASRLVQALGLHRRTGYRNMTYDEAQEAKNAFWWCYSIDKGLALNFGRSPQLLDYDIDVDLPEMQTDGKAYFIYCRAYIELARVQSRIYTELYSVAAGRVSRDERERATQSIVAELKSWWQRSCEAFSQCAEFQTQPDLIAETYLLRFGFYTNLALVYRVRSAHSTGSAPPFGTPPYDIDCLNSARQALAVCKILQTDFRDSFSLASIAQWLFLYYPLTPYFILFGNVVATGDTADLKIMEETMGFLNLVREESRGMEKLARLMTVFLRVATVLVEARKDGPRNSHGGMPVSPSSEHRLTRIPLPDASYAPQVDPGVDLNNGAALSTINLSPPYIGSKLNTIGVQELGGFSDMDWEAFALQPSMNFFAGDVGGEFAFLLGDNGVGVAGQEEQGGGGWNV